MAEDYSDIKFLVASGTFCPGAHSLRSVCVTPDGTSALVFEMQDSTDGTSGTLFRIRTTGTASEAWTLKHSRRCASAIYGKFVSGTGGMASAEIG